MSAAAILSVAARKAASEGKKVGAAALTLIALVVMSLTVFPGLNRATTDQMAEAPVNPGSSSEAGASAGTSEVTEDPGSAAESATTDPESADSSQTPGTPAQVSADPTPTPTAQAAKEIEEVKAILNSPALGNVFNSDSTSKVLVFDQDYTAIGDNGLIARFTFNPSSEKVFTNIRVEIEINGYFFEFKPANNQVISGKNGDGLEAFLLVGDATYVFDESGRTWSKSELGKSRVKIEVIMESNGTTVKSISLVMLGR
jgi:hypothetical protein